MLKNITLLEKLKPLSYLHDNANFPAYLKILAPFFQHDYKSASQEEREIFFYNLLYLAQRDLRPCLLNYSASLHPLKQYKNH